MMRESATFFEIIFDLFLWGCIFITLKPVLRHPYKVDTQKVFGACFLLLLFCLFPFYGGDYFHYIEDYETVKCGGYSHIEGIYVWFIKNCCPSYNMFRFGVWGLAILLLIQAFKRLEINTNLALFFFGVLYLPWFAYARASLAMAFIINGLSFIAKPFNKCKFLSYLLGICIMASSIFFHRTAAIGIACALCSLFFINPNKKTIVIFAIIFPLVILLLKYALNQFMILDLGSEDYLSGRQRDDYLTADSQGGLSMGVGPYIMVFLARAPLFVVALAYLYYAFKGYFVDVPKSVRIVSSYAFIIILLSLAFSLNLGYNTYTFYYRTLTFAHIPSAVFISQIYLSKCSHKLFKWIYYPTLLGIFYTFIYSAYCTLV